MTTTMPSTVYRPWPVIPDPCSAPVPCATHTAPIRHNRTPGIPRIHIALRSLAHRGPLLGRSCLEQKSYVTVKCWNIVASCALQYALYFPATSLSVIVFVPVNGTLVNVQDLPWGPSSS
jgi:hypothetical protein